MALTINTDVMSLGAQRSLSRSRHAMATSIERLSSGLRINSARDDAAGLAIAERMNARIRGMNVAIRNANDGISLAQTAEGALDEVGNVLQRMRELAVQSANAANSDADRDNLDAEFQALKAEIGRVAETALFNGVRVIGEDIAATPAAGSGSAAVVAVPASRGAGDFSFQVGADAGEVLRITTHDITADTDIDAVIDTASGAGATIASDTSPGADAADGATSAIALIDAAIDAVTSQRAAYGAVQSRLAIAIDNLQNGMRNQIAARARIVDADFAIEAAASVRSRILQQAGKAMASQANSTAQSVLRLLD